MESLLLLGAGGHARVVAETALSTGRFTSIASLAARRRGPAPGLRISPVFLRQHWSRMAAVKAR